LESSERIIKKQKKRFSNKEIIFDNKIFNFNLNSENCNENIIKEESSFHIEKDVSKSKFLHTKDINLHVKLNNLNILKLKIPPKYKRSAYDINPIYTPIRHFSASRYSFQTPLDNKEFNFSNPPNNNYSKALFGRLPTLNAKKYHHNNYSERFGIETGRRFSIKNFGKKTTIIQEKAGKKKVSLDINNNLNYLNTNNDQPVSQKIYSNKELVNLSKNSGAINSNNLFNNNKIGNTLNNYKKKQGKKITINENGNKIIPLTNKIYKNDYKGKLGDKKKHQNYNIFCDICLSSITVENTEETINLSCGHFYCRECIKEYIKNSIVKINTKNLNTACKCPKPVCGAAIVKKDIENILEDDEKNMEKFHKCMKIIDMINNLKNLIVCPIPDCDSFAKRELIEKNFVICEKGHKFCVKCSKFHDSKCLGLSPNDTLMEKFIKNNSDYKKCPKCSTLLYKFPDCDTNIVKCGYELCDYDYCWLCGRFPEKTHYTNPLSSCYKLEKIDNKHVLAKNNCLRMTKYFIIVLFTMLLIPFLIIFSTFLFVTFFILAFVPDGSAVKHIKMKTKAIQPIFKLLVTGIYVAMAFPLVPLGYMLQASFIILSPLILVYKKCISYKALYF